MRLKWILWICIISNYIAPAFSQPAKKSSGPLVWSDELPGRINWPDAMLQCEKKGMRLPTINELDNAYKSGLTKEWKYGLYWTSEEKPGDSNRALAYYFDFKKAYDDPKSNNINARCVK